MPADRDLFVHFARMPRAVDELFGDVFERGSMHSRRGFTPRVDVYYRGDPPRAVVIAELAGVDSATLGIEIRGRRLVIAGERRPRETGELVYQQVEMEQGPFRRAIELGAEVEADQATAAYDNGILRVELPIARPSRDARRVPIRQELP